MTAAVLSPLMTPKETHDGDSMLLMTTNTSTDNDDLSIPSLSDDVMMEEEDDPLSRSTMSSTSPLLTSPPPSDTTPAGLVNLGNTCYMNAALQALSGVDGIPDMLKGDGNNPVLREAFTSLVDSLLARSSAAVNPSDFKRIIDEQTPLFVGYRQQDSHEFLTTLLDLLHEEYQPKNKDDDDDKESSNSMDVETPTAEASPSPEAPPLKRCLTQLEINDIGDLLHGGKKKSNSTSRLVVKNHPQEHEEQPPQCKLVGGRSLCTGTWTEVQQEVATASPQHCAVVAASPPCCSSTCPIDDLFTTRVRTRITCDSCKHTRHLLETHRALSLEISELGGSVQESLRKFFSPQQLELKCEHCFNETATQTFEIVRLPRALLLHFKRFLVNVSSDWSSVTYRKNSASMEFSAIQLEEFMAMEASSCGQYKLSSVVNHIGSSASCGHYTADACRQEEWLRFNDSFVSKIDLQQATVQSKRTAYMVMYELQ